MEVHAARVDAASAEAAADSILDKNEQNEIAVLCATVYSAHTMHVR